MGWPKCLASITGTLSIAGFAGGASLALQTGLEWLISYATRYDPALELGKMEATGYASFAPPRSSRNCTHPFDETYGIDHTTYIWLGSYALVCLGSCLYVGRKSLKEWKHAIAPKLIAGTIALGSFIAEMQTVSSLANTCQSLGYQAGDCNGRTDGFNYNRCNLYPSLGCQVPETPHVHPIPSGLNEGSVTAIKAGVGALMAVGGLFGIATGKLWTCEENPNPQTHTRQHCC